MAARLGVSGRRAHQTCRQSRRRQSFAGIALPLGLGADLVAGEAGFDQPQIVLKSIAHVISDKSVPGAQLIQHGLDAGIARLAGEHDFHPGHGPAVGGLAEG